MVNSYLPKRDLIYLDGVSINTLGYYAEMPQPVPPAKQRYTIWSSGDTDFSAPDDSFEDVEYSFTVRKLRSANDFKATDLYALAANAKKLIISRHSGRYYIIKRLIGITPAAQLRGNDLTYSITFALSPFAYHLDNPETDVTQTHSLTNPGTRYSRPVYIIKYAGQGRTYLSVNGEVCSFDPPDSIAGTMYIDCEKMIAYNLQNGVNVNQTPCTDGKFPFLAPGVNLLSAYNDAQQPTELSVIGNWRDY